MQSTTAADYEDAVAIMALAPVRLALAALPVMQAQGHGRIVTITSIGGKIGVPHRAVQHGQVRRRSLRGLRAELGCSPVTMTTVVPGLMRTGSPVNAEFAGQQAKEFTWLAPAPACRWCRWTPSAGPADRGRGGAATAGSAATRAGQVVSRIAGVAQSDAAVLHPGAKAPPPAADGDTEAVPGRSVRSALPEPGSGR